MACVGFADAGANYGCSGGTLTPTVLIVLTTHTEPNLV